MPQVAVMPSRARVASREVRRSFTHGRLGAQPLEQRDVRVARRRASPASRGRTGRPPSPGGRTARGTRPTPMCPSPMRLVPVLEGAAHVHRVVGVHQAQPAGPADLDDPVEGRGRCRRARRAARRPRRRGRCRGRCRPWGGGRGRRGTAPGPRRRRTASGPGRRSAPAAATVRRRRRPPRAAAAVPRGPGASRRRSRSVEPPGSTYEPGVHDDALGADLGGAAQVVGDRWPPTSRTSRGRAAEVHQVRRVDERPGCRVSRAGLAGTARPRGARRRTAPSRGGCRRRPGASRSRARRRGRERAGDQPLADRDVGADRVAQGRVEGRSSASRAAGACPEGIRAESAHDVPGRRQITMRVTVLPLSARSPWPGSTLTTQPRPIESGCCSIFTSNPASRSRSRRRPGPCRRPAGPRPAPVPSRPASCDLVALEEAAGARRLLR